MKEFLRRAVRPLLAVGAALLAVSVVVMALEDSLIYYPTTGGRVHGPGRDVSLRAADGVRLHAWYVETPGAPISVLYLHGNAGNLATRSGLLAELTDLRVHLLALDYRGYGQSEGKPSEAGLYRDAAAAHAWLEQRVAPGSIVVLGESLGGGPACELAVSQQLGGLVLLSTFTSIPDMARRVFPFLPTRWLVRTRFDNLDKIARAQAPKLLVHSRRDETIPFAMAERLYAAAPEPKRQLWLERAGHNDAFVVEREPLVGALRTFLDSVASSEQRRDGVP